VLPEWTVFIAYGSGSVDVDVDVIVSREETLMIIHMILPACRKLTQAGRIT